jgi:2-phosphosulfolactate phosphatase
MKVVVVIDVFRAFTTASYALSKKPSAYYLAVKQSIITELASKQINPLIIGKPEIGLSGDLYHIPNSPTRLQEMEVEGRVVIHRTEAGARGVLQATSADIVLAAGFVNAKATALFLSYLKDAEITYYPMGHEGNTPSLEDDLCAQYIAALVTGNIVNIKPYIPHLKTGAGSYFFGADQKQYPEKDFERCLELNRFDFPIRADIKNNYALLSIQEISK